MQERKIVNDGGIFDLIRHFQWLPSNDGDFSRMIP